jgi:uncharacterized protein YyaL (SSP411 family)
VHWWRDSTLYAGAGFDWRYEGIIYGYLTLHQRTGARRWLDKAIRAADDLVAAQLPNGNFMCSGFEQNPSTSGTPHEAAADSALLALAATLKREGQPEWETYATTARRNLERCHIARLWDEEAQLFRDDPKRASFVPNKACTIVEALFRLSDLTGEQRWLERYARPTLNGVLRHQVRTLGAILDGAIAQNVLGTRVIEKYFPYYVARCVPGLLRGYDLWRDERFLDSAVAAGYFILRVRETDGGFPQVSYPGGQVNRYPRWIAATGDVLRALAMLRERGLTADLDPTRRWLLAGQLPSGAFRVAEGFASSVTQHAPKGRPDERDTAPVVGWNDKAFRYLAEQVS